MHLHLASYAANPTNISFEQPTLKCESQKGVKHLRAKGKYEKNENENFEFFAIFKKSLPIFLISLNKTFGS